MKNSRRRITDNLSEKITGTFSDELNTFFEFHNLTITYVWSDMFIEDTNEFRFLEETIDD